MTNAPSRRRLASSLALALLLAGLGAAGCKPKAVRGGAGTDNPNLDQGAMSTGLDKVDLDYLSRTNLDKLFTSPIWAQWKTGGAQPVVAIWPIKNDTSEHVDDQLLTLLSNLETEFINSGVVAVVSRERQAEMVSEVNVQNSDVFDPSTAARIGKQIGAQYFITGKLQATDERFDKERRVQYSLFMQVIEVETSIVRFQHKSERTKAIVR
jgi:uncharacterized protein (TIGR02722 family)